ncbi:MAG: hypothetical protein LBV00_04165 [Propionibacteriaceae bacterium]|jgi:hypothetical protein|nr:hypothetical protein [Propionibacteriaceae bacterium]
MNRITKVARALGRFINRTGVVIMRSVNLVSFLVTAVLIIAVLGAYFADKYLANGYYCDYLVQSVMNMDVGWVPELARRVYLYPVESLVIVGAFFLVGSAVKLLLRKAFVRKGKPRTFFGTVANVILNVALNMILVVMLTGVVATVALVSHRYSGPEVATGAGDYQSASMAINEIMIEIEKDPGYVTNLTVAERGQLRRQVNHLIDLQLGPKSPWEHYLRNLLNEGPATLDEMMATFAHPEVQQWTLLPPDQAAYHMFGPEGEFNLKFVSADGLLEAVYNKAGVLLTEDNDPVNMGTYNFADPVTQSKKHSTYDVLPYYQWGNTAGTWSIAHDVMGPLHAVDRYSSSSAAVAHYESCRAKIAAAKGQQG